MIKIFHACKTCLRTILFIAVLVVWQGFGNYGWGQTTQTFTSNGTFTVPAGVTSIKVECWGAGGGGSTITSWNQRGGGGGGGAYASSEVSVIPGNSYSIIVGIGGYASGSGSNSSFNTNSVVAAGGSGVNNNTTTGGSGGSFASSIGTIKFAGGNGASGGTTFSGGGGGGAGSTGAGGNALGESAGTGTLLNGGNGGYGVSGSNNGINGSTYGGGGSGAVTNSGFDRTGSSGANGLVVISWVPVPTLSVSPSSINFGYVLSGGTSLESTYSLSGTFLTGAPGNISITAPTNFEVSLTSGFGFSSSVSVPYASSTLAAITIYVRFKPTSPNTNYNGNITNSGGGAASQNVAVTGTTVIPYCPSNGNMTYQTSITLVNFNTINNISAKPAGYSDYTSLSTSVIAGSSYNLTVNLNTDGNYNVYARAWIDWNQNGNFIDAGEVVDLGVATNTANGPTNLSPFSINIPSGAVSGNTRIRISAKYYAYPASCDIGYDGEVEDYTINIIPTISTGTITGSPFCAGASVSIPYTISGTFTSGNVFTAQLSNSVGSFASPVNIGTLTSTTAGTISGTFPAGTATGAGYRIRVVSSSPAIAGTNNGSNLTVNSIPTITGTTPGSTCGSGTVTLDAAASAGTINWYAASIGGASLGTGTSYTTPSLSATKTYYVDATNNGCTTATRTSVVATVNTIPTPPGTTGGFICIGSTATLSASGAVSGQFYKWYNAASGGTLLKTSSNNLDNTYTTPVLASTTDYWVSILSGGACESSRTLVTATYPTTSTDDQNAAGTDSWIGHVYDGTNFLNYIGHYTEAETFNESFGGSTNCFNVTSNSTTRSIYTTTFSVRYRMNSTKKGLYVVDLGSDDGSRLTVDGTLLYDNWKDQSFSTRARVLMSLNGASSLVYDFYENGGGNQVIFQNLTLVLANSLSTNIAQSICLGNTGAAISGDIYGTLPSGITLSGTGYQWAYSTISGTGPWTDISGETAATYTPSSAIAPFNAAGTYYLIRKALVSSANNVAPIPYVASNESNSAILTVRPTPVATISGTTTVCQNATSPNITFTNPQTVPVSITYNINGANQATINVGASTTATLAAATSTAGIFSYNLVSVIYQSAPACSNTITDTATITVSPAAPATPGVISGTTSQCPGLTNQTYSIGTVTNATTYTWTVPTGWSVTSGAGTNSITVTTGSAGQNGNITVTAGNSCGTSAARTLAVTVSTNLPVSVIIAASANPVCAGTGATFTATPTNGGTTPAYQWKVNGNNVGTNSSTYSYTPANNDVVTCMLTSNVTCSSGNPATSNTITITLNPISAGGTATSNQTICSGSSPSDITLTGQTGTIQWQTSIDNITFNNVAGATASLLTSAQMGTLSATRYYRAIVTSGVCSSANSNVVMITVNDIPDLSGLLTSATNTCSGSSSVITISATNLPNGTYTVNYTLTGANPQGATDVALIVSSGNSGTFNTPVLASAGTTNLTINSLKLTSCATTASSGNTATITTTTGGSWLGITSTDWHTASNWCGGIPTSTTDVTIPSGAPNQPVIGTAAVCNNITIDPGASLTITGSNTLTASGSWTNNGTFIPNSSTVIFNSSGASNIGSSTFNNLTISGTGAKTETGNIVVNGNFTLSAGTFRVSISTTQSNTLTIAGNYIQTGGVLDFNPTGNGAISILNIAGNLTNSAGSGSITTNGPGATNGQIIFSGSSLQTVTFSIASASIWTTYTANAGSRVKLGSNITLTGDASEAKYYADFIVNGTIDFGTYILNDTPYGNIAGASHFILNSGASLITADPAGISLSGNSGSVQFNGPRTYNSSANYSYNGASGQISGNGLTSANNLTSNNSAGLTLSKDVSVSNTLTLTAGILTNNYKLTLHGDLNFSNGAIINSSAASSTIVYAGTSAQFVPAASFLNNEIYNLVVNNPSGVTLLGPLKVTGVVNAQNGNLSSSGNLTLVSSAAQTALIDGSGTGSVTGNVTMQRYLPSGYGYKYISSPFQASTVNELADDIDLAASFPMLYKYDEDNHRDSSGVLIYTTGWSKYITTTEPLIPMQGYAANFGNSPITKTVNITGVVNNNIGTSLTLYNHDRLYTKGFNLIGNPYPSPIDWNATTGWTKTNIDNALYFFDAGTTDPYTGTYSTYINGVSSNDTAGSIIPSMQGFFIHVSDGSYPVSATLGMDNRVRVNNLSPAFHKSAEVQTQPMIRLTAAYENEKTPDHAVVYFDDYASTSFDQLLDALKLMNTDVRVPNLYAVTPKADKLSISAIPYPSDSITKVPLGLKTEQENWVTFKATAILNMPTGLYVYLSDAITGKIQNLQVNPEYRVHLAKGMLENRFVLLFSESELTDTFVDNNTFNANIENGKLNVYVKLASEKDSRLIISNMLGQVMLQQNLFGNGLHEIDHYLHAGMYILTLYSSQGLCSHKIYIPK
ncbi:MAG: GEVED domain-containing protein [Lentimicrobiaceae bacterium]|jgi:hypothetical protein